MRLTVKQVIMLPVPKPERPEIIEAELDADQGNDDGLPKSQLLSRWACSSIRESRCAGVWAGRVSGQRQKHQRTRSRPSPGQHRQSRETAESRERCRRNLCLWQWEGGMRGQVRETANGKRLWVWVMEDGGGG